MIRLRAASWQCNRLPRISHDAALVTSLETLRTRDAALNRVPAAERVRSQYLLVQVRAAPA